MNYFAYNRTVCFIALVSTIIFSLSTCSGYLFAADVTEVVEEVPVGVESEPEQEKKDAKIFSMEEVIPGKEPLKLAKRFYIGGGFHYDIANLDANVTVVDYFGYTAEGNTDFDNTWGFDLKGGYFFSEIFALELLFQYHDNFKASDSFDPFTHSGHFWDESGDYSAELTVYDFTVNGKVYLPLNNTIFKPYGVVGIGIMIAKVKWDAAIYDWDSYGIDYSQSVEYSGSENKVKPCGRIGAGCDVFFNQNFGLEAEVAYNSGFGSFDFEEDLDVAFTSLSIGALYAF